MKEGLLYVGTDDGLIQVTEDGGETGGRSTSSPACPSAPTSPGCWRRSHAEQTVYAAFDNHKNGDFKPYLLRTTDGGRTWASIAGDLPERGSVLAIAEDHEDPNLLFAGTEFGLFFTPDGGKKWVRLKGGLPTIAVRDLAIQRGENDLVVGTFGRGIYVLDDYSLLRGLKPETLQKEAALFPVKDALLLRADAAVRTARQGVSGRGVLRGGEPAVWGDVHLPPQGRDQDRQAAATRRGEEGRRAAATRRRTSCAPRPRRSPRRSS